MRIHHNNRLFEVRYSCMSDICLSTAVYKIIVSFLQRYNGLFMQHILATYDHTRFLRRESKNKTPNTWP